MARFGMGGRTKTQGIDIRHRTRPHGEDIAQDAPNTCCGTLIGFDEGGMIMAFHFENRCITVANVHNARIFPGAIDHLWAVGWQGLEPFFR